MLVAKALEHFAGINADSGGFLSLRRFSWSLCRAEGQDLPSPHRRPFQAAQAQTGAKVESVPQGWPRCCCGPGCEDGLSAFLASLWSQQPMSVDGPCARNGCLFFVDTDSHQFPRRLLTASREGWRVCLHVCSRDYFFPTKYPCSKSAVDFFLLMVVRTGAWSSDSLSGSVWGPLSSSAFPLR